MNKSFLALIGVVSTLALASCTPPPYRPPNNQHATATPRGSRPRPTLVPTPKPIPVVNRAQVTLYTPVLVRLTEKGSDDTPTTFEPSDPHCFDNLGRTVPLGVNNCAAIYWNGGLGTSSETISIFYHSRAKYSCMRPIRGTPISTDRGNSVSGIPTPVATPQMEQFTANMVVVRQKGNAIFSVPQPCLYVVSDPGTDRLLYDYIDEFGSVRPAQDRWLILRIDSKMWLLLDKVYKRFKVSDAVSVTPRDQQNAAAATTPKVSVKATPIPAEPTPEDNPTPDNSNDNPDQNVPDQEVVTEPTNSGGVSGILDSFLNSSIVLSIRRNPTTAIIVVIVIIVLFVAVRAIGGALRRSRGRS